MLVKSEELNEIAAALVEVQAEIKDAEKTQEGYGYNYADLGQVLGIIRPILSKHGIAMVQMPGSNGDKICVMTMLIHKSGQFIGRDIAFEPTPKKGMSPEQTVGTLITYFRRYGASAINNMTQEDTDGADPANADGKDNSGNNFGNNQSNNGFRNSNPGNRSF